MKLPRITIGRLMGGVVILALGLGLLLGDRSGRSLTGISDLALWPTLTAFGIGLIVILRRRGRSAPFLWGFVAVGWISVLGYLGLCGWSPELMRRFLVFYWNDLDSWWIVWFIDSDDMIMYDANRVVIGLILATPQLMMAGIGGLITRDFWWNRWTTT